MGTGSPCSVQRNLWEPYKLLLFHAEAGWGPLDMFGGLLQGYVQSLFDEGVVNNQFSQIQTLKSMEQPDIVVQLIDTYFVDVEIILSELTSYSDFPNVDFSKLALLADKVKEKSSCIGAEHVRLACDELIQASDQMHKQKYEFSLQLASANLKSLFDEISEEEKSPTRLACSDEDYRKILYDVVLLLSHCHLQSFFRALSFTKNEFTRTRKKLEAYARMEHKIIRLESRQRR
ncbi:hypothetical protein FNV43_RR05735 [Rhamnella rubrinervis]|uniref:Histidine-containing phosphotransfer protein n=1 Tax=Rhamnella rubrinervis TaxID=2594499 RepID=A0A8K0MQY0_9ROSA|nr:hypothetical protein FNV43_RR05735 [Rhamnella rubrinervis]